MFGKEKIRELETRLAETRSKLDAAEKDAKGLQDKVKTAADQIRELEQKAADTARELETATAEKLGLQEELEAANAKISDLEKRVADHELENLKAQSQQTIVEYEGLKGLYNEKIKEFEDSKTAAEEEFAREAANKRHNLSEEIRENRESNEKLVSETISTFAGSYTYYLDQIRTLMDALSNAARETGENLFHGDTGNIRERFGTAIVEHLRSDAEGLKQNAGDVLLIGAEEAAEAEKAECCEEAAECCEETAECCQEAAECCEEAKECCGGAAETVTDESECAQDKEGE